MNTVAEDLCLTVREAFVSAGDVVANLLMAAYLTLKLVALGFVELCNSYRWFDGEAAETKVQGGG